MMTRKINVLVVEDNSALREQLVSLLSREGYLVQEASDGRIALATALDTPPDVILLDIGLAGMNGLAVCQQIRERASHHIPILMLTARDTLNDKLEGFQSGADDYLSKPFATQELLARILVLVRRHVFSHHEHIEIGPLLLDMRLHQAYRDQQLLVLSPTEFSILLMLAQAWPGIVTRSTIINRLWQDELPDSDPLRTHLYQLRKILDKPFNYPMLKTVYGHGFRLQVVEP